MEETFLEEKIREKMTKKLKRDGVKRVKREDRCDEVGSVQICFYSDAVISRAETKHPSGKYTLIIT